MKATMIDKPDPRDYADYAEYQEAMMRYVAEQPATDDIKEEVERVRFEEEGEE